MAASDEAELVHMVATAASYGDGPIAFRFPRGEGTGAKLPKRGQVLSIGRGRVLCEGGDVAILSLGARLQAALLAAERLEASGIAVTVADARFAKPLDKDLVEQLARHHGLLVTVEDGAMGGFGAHVLQYLANEGLLRPGLEVRSMTLPGIFQDHDDPARQYATAGLDTDGIHDLIAARFVTRTRRQT